MVYKVLLNMKTNAFLSKALSLGLVLLLVLTVACTRRICPAYAKDVAPKAPSSIPVQPS